MNKAKKLGSGLLYYERKKVSEKADGFSDD
jgi:hypothetical protein